MYRPVLYSDIFLAESTDAKSETKSRCKKKPSEIA